LKDPLTILELGVAKQWDIWIPKNNHPSWRPDEQTYAVETNKGYYNDETYAKIDHTISYSAYGELLSENQLLLQNVDDLRSENEALIKKLKAAGIEIE
jgi:hypothetical protein